jgi:hypothetical protein
LSDNMPLDLTAADKAILAELLRETIDSCQR